MKQHNMFIRTCNTPGIGLFVGVILFSLFINLTKTEAQAKILFKPGEKVVFDAYYNLGFVWLHAGQGTFTASVTTYKQQPAYVFNATGVTFNGYDYIFRVRDTLTTIVDKQNIKPLWSRQKTHEGSYEAEILYHFNYDSNLVRGVKIRKDKKKHAVYSLKPDTRDMLSMIYFMRGIDFNRYKKGDLIPFSMVVDNEMHDLYVRYVDKEIVKLKSGRSFRCIVLSPLLLEGSVFSGGEGMKLYITDDRNRLPVYIESKVLVGKVKASLESYQNLQFPLTSEIK